ncbi:hypothetical protein CAEBREN_29914 [Caenorhabditis brenneri]|uniref:Uncharacterized protein n=1 Tax=Caenorhabditis brenneri TaxID=135651 RepID=G0NRI1_CAEBE|nr:hypothetical protein CAEBREN_29914 [Caenorhabditis brenneri]
MKFENSSIFLVILFCSFNVSSSNNSTIASQSPPETTTPTPLKCSRDYHCPSKCDTCLSGICTHQLNLNCTRDYHCPPCEVCRSGKCVEGESKKCETVSDCEGGGWCREQKCIENKCQEDGDCGNDKAVCKNGKCEFV